MRVTELEKELKKTLCDFYRVTCKDALSINNIKKAFMESVPIEERGISLITCDTAMQVDEIVNEARTYSFGSRKKIIFVEPKKSISENEKKLLIEYANEVDKSTTIVFFDQENVFSFLNRYSQQIEGIPAEREELKSYILNKIKIQDYFISPEAADTIAYYCGASPERIDKEITKLLYYKADDKNISLKDVEVMVSEDIEVKAFDLTNYFTKRQFSKALEVLESQLRHGVKPITLLSSLTVSYRRLFFISLIKDEQEVATLLNTSEASVKVNRKIITQSGYTQSKLKKILDYLYEVEFGFKSGKYSERSALDLATAYLFLL